MSEWLPLLAVFWVLYLVDGLQVPGRRRFSFVAWFGKGRAIVSQGRFHCLGILPACWRAWADDLPLSFSPAGISNEPAGWGGRPVELPGEVSAWRWEDVRDVQVKSSWLWVNGRPFAPATPYFSHEGLSRLAARCAALPLAAREELLRNQLRGWLRPAHLRRRAAVWRARTGMMAGLNGIVCALMAALTACWLFDVPGHLPDALAVRLAHIMPWLIGYAVLLHAVALVLAWRVHRRLPQTRRALRGGAWVSALLLPPQALHLRAVLGEAWFPPMHPLACAVALAPRAAAQEIAFQTLADIRWPVPGQSRSPLADEIVGWFRVELSSSAEAMLRAAGIAPEDLLAAPAPNSTESCAYCPRCRDQFVDCHARCPLGIPLLPLK